jgi:WD40 repeat protein
MQVLYAPMLADDFYLNLIDWSSQNVLSVGLGRRAYLQSACTEQVTQLCNLSDSGNSITSVAWNEQVSNNSISLFLCRTVNCISVIYEYCHVLGFPRQ